MSKKAKLIKEDLGIIGEVGVDSGQVIVMDYSMIEKFTDDNMVDRRVYRHRDGTLLQYESGITLDKGAIGFQNYATIIPKYGKTMNDINSAGDAVKLENKVISNLSYSGACSVTLTDTGYGFLGEKSAFATRTLYGDGGYEVKNYGKMITVNFNYSDGDEGDIAREVPAGEVNLPSRKLILTDPCYIRDGEWNNDGVLVEMNTDRVDIIACLDKDGGMVMVKIMPMSPSVKV